MITQILFNYDTLTSEQFTQETLSAGFEDSTAYRVFITAPSGEILSFDLTIITKPVDADEATKVSF
jgi:hypothetical protein